MPATAEKTSDDMVKNLPEMTTIDEPSQDQLSIQGGQLQEHFNLWSCLGVNASVTAAPLILGTYLTVAYSAGGAVVFFWAFGFAASMQVIVCLCMAELAAVYPHTAGQSHWTAVLAPAKSAPFLSYLVGYISSVGWLLCYIASALLTSQLIWALVLVFQTDLVVKPWQYYLVMVGVMVYALLWNGPIFRFHPMLFQALVIVLPAGVVYILITLLVRTKVKQSATAVFATFVNETGWSSDGMVFFLGFLPALATINVFDAATHLTEEMSHPKKQVPQVMVYNALINVIVSLPMILVYLFCTTNPVNLFTPIGNQAIVQLLLDSLDSVALTAIGTTIFIICLSSATIACQTTLSRLWWSLILSGAAPGRGFFSKLSDKQSLPINILVLVALIGAALGLIQIGSTLALNAITGAAAILLLWSYIIPIGLLLMGGRYRLDEDGKRAFNLGRLGFFLNIVACIWVMFVSVWLCFPLYYPVTWQNMNYASIVSVGFGILTVANWYLFARKHHTVPAPYIPKTVLGVGATA